MKVNLGDCAQLIKSRVGTEEALEDSYVSTDNMLPNRGGIKFGDSNLPKSETVNDYQKGDILVSNIRPYFKKIWFADRDGTRSGDVLCFRARNVGILDEYLYCVLQSDSFFNYVVATSKGTKMPRGDKKAILNYEFDLPSREEQYKKYNPILLIEEKIRLNNQINNNLFKLAKIHFDRQLDSENIKFSQISTIQNGYAFKSKEYVDTNELMILRTKNINDNHLFSKNDVVYISKELFDEYKRFSFSAFDTVLVMVGASIGKTGFVTSNMTPSLQNQNMWRFRPKMSNIPGLLIFQYVNYINKHIIGSATGSARSFYRKKLFSEFEVPRINSTNYIYFDTLQREIDHLNTENEILYRIKHSLLNHYF